jgi:hypothetical protein
MAPYRGLGNAEYLGNLFMSEFGEVAQLDDLGFLRRVDRQLFEGIMDG